MGAPNDRLGPPAELTHHEQERRRVEDESARGLMRDQRRPADRVLAEAIQRGAVADDEIPQRVADVDAFVETYRVELGMLSMMVDLRGVDRLVLASLTPGQRTVVLHQGVAAMQAAIADVVAELEPDYAAA
jgi:hypothetical protein